MTIFKVVRSYCGFRVNTNYIPKDGHRARYFWICAKRESETVCSEDNCPMVKKINKCTKRTQPCRSGITCGNRTIEQVFREPKRSVIIDTVSKLLKPQ